MTPLSLRNNNVEYAAAMSDRELHQRVISSNGLDREADIELRRRQLGELTGARRSPAELLRELELRREPDDRTPAEKLLWLESRRHLTADGVDPRELLMQMHAYRIAADDF
jgi:hypothetical protein